MFLEILLMLAFLKACMTFYLMFVYCIQTWNLCLNFVYSIYLLIHFTWTYLILHNFYIIISVFDYKMRFSTYVLFYVHRWFQIGIHVIGQNIVWLYIYDDNGVESSKALLFDFIGTEATWIEPLTVRTMVISEHAPLITLVIKVPFYYESNVYFGYWCCVTLIIHYVIQIYLVSMYLFVIVNVYSHSD